MKVDVVDEKGPVFNVKYTSPVFLCFPDDDVWTVGVSVSIFTPKHIPLWWFKIYRVEEMIHDFNNECKPTFFSNIECCVILQKDGGISYVWKNHMNYFCQ